MGRSTSIRVARSGDAPQSRCRRPLTCRRQGLDCVLTTLEVREAKGPHCRGVVHGWPAKCGPECQRLLDHVPTTKWKGRCRPAPRMGACSATQRVSLGEVESEPVRGPAPSIPELSIPAPGLSENGKSSHQVQCVTPAPGLPRGALPGPTRTTKVLSPGTVCHAWTGTTLDQPRPRTSQGFKAPRAPRTLGALKRRPFGPPSRLHCVGALRALGLYSCKEGLRPSYFKAVELQSFKALDSPYPLTTYSVSRSPSTV